MAAVFVGVAVSKWRASRHPHAQGFVEVDQVCKKNFNPIDTMNTISISVLSGIFTLSVEATNSHWDFPSRYISIFLSLWLRLTKHLIIRLAYTKMNHFSDHWRTRTSYT